MGEVWRVAAVPVARAMQDRLAAAAGFDRALVPWRCETVSATLRFLNALRAEAMTEAPAQ